MPSEEQTYRAGVKDQLNRIENKIDQVDKKATYTNGKVRKIVIALVLIGGIIIGQSFTNTQEIISAVIGIVR